MLFDSTACVLFLILVVLIYGRLSFRKQNCLLLAVSYLFYGWWDGRFPFLMAGSTRVHYLVARQIAASSNERQRQALMVSLSQLLPPRPV